MIVYLLRVWWNTDDDAVLGICTSVERAQALAADHYAAERKQADPKAEPRTLDWACEHPDVTTTLHAKGTYRYGERSAMRDVDFALDYYIESAELDAPP